MFIDLNKAIDFIIDCFWQRVLGLLKKELPCAK
jgi:hypothetical protein